MTGDFGEKPTIKIDSPLKVSKTTSWTTEEGKGDKVGAEATTILSLTLANARTGKTAISTTTRASDRSRSSSATRCSPPWPRRWSASHADSRVVVASSADDAYGDTGAAQIGIKPGDSVVMVADVLSTDPTKVLDGPTGDTIPAPATAPKILEKDGDLTGLDFTGLKKPTGFAAIQLREGTGPEVETPDRIAADYMGQVWGGKEPFNNTYGKEPARFSIGLGGSSRPGTRVSPASRRAPG